MASSSSILGDGPPKPLNNLLMEAHRCSTAAQNAAFSGFWQEAVQKHMEAAQLFEEASAQHKDEQVAKGMRLLAVSERKKAQEMIRQVEMARAVTPPRTVGPSRLAASISLRSSTDRVPAQAMPHPHRAGERAAPPTVLKGIAVKPGPAAGGGLDSAASIDRAAIVSPEAVAVVTTMQAAAAEAGTGRSSAALAGQPLPVATESFSWDRFWVAVEELLEILPKPLFDGQDNAADVLGGLEEDFIAIRRSSSISLGGESREDLTNSTSPRRESSPFERSLQSPSAAEDGGFFVVPSPRQFAASGLKNSSSMDLPTVRVFLDEVDDDFDAVQHSPGSDEDEEGAESAFLSRSAAHTRLLAENRRLRQESEKLRQDLRLERRNVAELSKKHEMQQRTNDNLTKRILLFRRELKARVDELHLFSAHQLAALQPHTAGCKEEMVIARGAPRILQMEVTIAEQAEQLEKQKTYIAQLEKRWNDLQAKAKKRKSLNQSHSSASSAHSGSDASERTIVQPSPRHVRNPSLEQLLDQ